MKTNSWRLFAGVGLILAGGLFLLSSLNILDIGGLVIGGFFMLGGLAFLFHLMTNRSAWWAAIPGCVLVGIGAAILLGNLGDGRWSGMAVLGGIALAFWLVYLLNTANWWAIIPAGVMTTLVAVTGLEGLQVDEAGIFLFGLAITFALVALLPSMGTRKTWAWWPAGILAIIGVLALFSAMDWMNYLWGVGLILAGGFLAWRALRPAKS
ncbi:MAG TPA: hypothetical protein PLA25_05675 [Anaerolineaceae bacterium]|jgi:hypothetical protein|nr:hypothetical protein [Longilinea sp.]HNZ12309.1 hypothetical protein [Anaerolineaceae bacterium]HOG78496.1 hypothetical protein [Anaerolineaceae bacterium]HQF61896.1 hypothetical protein [Anaerolineaceae bacterium]HQH84920.1 hypothetical protein [Anaerolineaceae bacterium]